MDTQGDVDAEEDFAAIKRILERRRGVKLQDIPPDQRDSFMKRTFDELTAQYQIATSKTYLTWLCLLSLQDFSKRTSKPASQKI